MLRSLALVVAPVVALAACGGPRFLGARIGSHCDEIHRCRGWVHERLVTHAPTYERDDALRAYVASVVARLARANHLSIAPRVVITADGSASALPSDAISISTTLLASLDSEAALAGVLAHELAHVDAGTAHWFEDRDSEDDQQWWRDIESLADERAVGFMITAGYDPHGMLDMLAAIARANPEGDNLHPTALQRRARVATLLAGRGGGELARERYHAHVDATVVGVDPRLLAVLDHAIVSIAADVAFAKPADPYSVTLAIPAATELVIGSLRDTRRTRAAGHDIVIGVMPADVVRPDPSKQSIADEAIQAELASLMHTPEAGARVIILRGSRGDLWIELTGRGTAARAEDVVAHLHAPTAAERASVAPQRVHDLANAGIER